MITNKDPAELPAMATDDDPSKHNCPGYCRRCGCDQDLVCPICGSTDTESESTTRVDRAGMMEKFRRLLMQAQQQRNAKYYIGCILIATGDPAAEGVNLTEYARQWGVTRAAVSKHCVAICAYLGIAPSEYMRSESSRQAYRLHNKRKTK